MNEIKNALDNDVKSMYNNGSLAKGGDSLRIAICDDDDILRLQLRKLINGSDILPPDAEISEFSGGTDLIKSQTERPFDVIFLDIEMGDISGIETGQGIRSADRSVIIIFLTSHEQYVFQSFKIEAFDYILKPADNEKVTNVLSRALQKYKEQHHIINCKWQDACHALEVNEIVYVEGYRRHVVFVTKDNRYECVGKLNDYEKQMAPYGFLKCHQGFLINMNHIKRIESTCITTVCGKTVDMSVRKKQDCLKAFNTFLTKYRV